MEYMIISDNEEPCLICGKPTKNVDLSHARICSEECLKKFNKMVSDNEQ